MNPRAKEIEFITPYSMIVTFTNNETKEFDFSPFLHYAVYNPLRDILLFQQAKVFNGAIC